MVNLSWMSAKIPTVNTELRDRLGTGLKLMNRSPIVLVPLNLEVRLLSDPYPQYLQPISQVAATEEDIGFTFYIRKYIKQLSSITKKWGP